MKSIYIQPFWGENNGYFRIQYNNKLVQTMQPKLTNS